MRLAVITTGLAAVVAAVPPSALAQSAPKDEKASGTIVTVTGGGDATTLGETTATVTTGTSSEPATGTVVVIDDGGESAGEASSDVSTPSSQTQGGAEVTSNATASGTEGSSETSPAETTAVDTRANVEIGTGRIVAGSGAVHLRIRGGRSRSTARRRGRSMETSALTTLGSDGSGNGLSIDGLVTVGRLHAVSRSRSGLRTRSRRRFSLRDLRIRGVAGESAVIHVRWARMLADGRLRARITLRPSSGPPLTRTIMMRQSRHGRDLLSRSTYRRTALAAAFRELKRSRLEDVEARLRAVRMGGSHVSPGSKRTTAHVKGLTVELWASSNRTGAGTSQLGFVTAVAGAVSSAATAARTSLVTVAQETAVLSVALAESAADLPADLQAVLGGESLTIRSRVERLTGHLVRLMITCAADFSGELFLFDPANGTRPLANGHARLTCTDGQRIRVTLELKPGPAAAIKFPDGLRVLPKVDVDDTLEFLVLEPVRLIEP